MSPVLRRALLCVLISSTSPLFGAWEAKLSTSDGAPAAGYTVAVVGRPLTAICDGEGRFRLEPAPTPPFALVATSPEGVVSAPLEVVDLATGELRLLEVVREAVTVVSGVAPSLELLPGSAATVLTREELEQRAPQRLYQALESVAGASKLGDGADSVYGERGDDVLYGDIFSETGADVLDESKAGRGPR